MKCIVHVIDNLERGGAETLLLDLLPVLSEHYNIILVTLEDRNEFDENVYQYCYKHYCLDHKGNMYLPRTVYRLSQIIRNHQPVLVRSQLIWSTIITRLACPNKIPLVFSVHITMEVFNETVLGPALATFEKLTLSDKNTMIGVSKAVVDGYVKKFNFRGRSFVLHNYVKKEFFNDRRNEYNKNSLRMVAVGNLRQQKNYQFLIEAFKLLKQEDVYLDIYGNGPQYQSLDEQIKEHSLSITLKGKSGKIPEIMKGYDAFVMVSSFEGFGIVVAEAMAAGLPLILSDIPVLREVAENNAFFIDPAKPETFVELTHALLKKEKDILIYLESNNKTVNEKYTQNVYLKKLLNIYEEAILSKANNSIEINKK
jgi:glycosyltransferase involved in cell wall biosynthesis